MNLTAGSAAACCERRAQAVRETAARHWEDHPPSTEPGHGAYDGNLDVYKRLVTSATLVVTGALLVVTIRT